MRQRKWSLHFSGQPVFSSGRRDVNAYGNAGTSCKQTTRPYWQIHVKNDRKLLNISWKSALAGSSFASVQLSAGFPPVWPKNAPPKAKTHWHKRTNPRRGMVFSHLKKSNPRAFGNFSFYKNPFRIRHWNFQAEKNESASGIHFLRLKRLIPGPMRNFWFYEKRFRRRICSFETQKNVSVPGEDFFRLKKSSPE